MSAGAAIWLAGLTCWLTTVALLLNDAVGVLFWALLVAANVLFVAGPLVWLGRS